MCDLFFIVDVTRGVFERIFATLCQKLGHAKLAYTNDRLLLLAPTLTLAIPPATDEILWGMKCSYVFNPVFCVTLNGLILGGWVFVVDVTRGLALR